MISDSEILVKVHAAALNPIDFKSIDLLASRESIIGCDYAGEVAEVGKNALDDWKVGDRVAGFVHGGQYSDRGSFCKYLKIDGDLVWRVPDELSDEEASTYGVPAATAMLALNIYLGVPWLDAPSAEPKTQLQTTESRGTILIYAGSTAVGPLRYAACKEGWLYCCHDRIATFLRSREKVWCGLRLRLSIHDRGPRYSQGILQYHPSTRLCIRRSLDRVLARVIKRSGGKIVTLSNQGKSKVQSVQYVFIIVFTAFGQKFALLPPIGPSFPASLFDRDALARFYVNVPQLINDVKPPPLRVLGSGFDKMLSGLDELRQGKVSGRKLVVKL